jgi:hypothetical protein
MKKMLMLAPALLLVANALQAQGANPRGEAKLELDGQAISIDYGRPSLRGRDMLGQAGVGQTWRMGADAATKLVTSAPLHFGETEVAAGEHVLRAKKVADDAWHMVIVGEADETQEVPFAASTGDESVEQFTIELVSAGDAAGEVVLSWGTVILRTPFSLKK